MGRHVTTWPIGRGQIEQWEDDQGLTYYRAVLGDQVRSSEDLWLAELNLSRMVKNRPA